MPWEKNFDADAVLARAMEVFWAHGYVATSMQDIVDATGVNRASLYATYGDKRALFLAALRKYDSEVRSRMLGELAGKPDASAAIAAVFDRFIEQTSVEGANRGCLLTNTALELAAHDPEIGGFVAASQADLEDFFRRMVARGQQQGRFDPARDPAGLARHLLASLLGLLVLVRSRPDPAFLRSIRDSALLLLE